MSSPIANRQGLFSTPSVAAAVTWPAVALLAPLAAYCHTRAGRLPLAPSPIRRGRSRIPPLPLHSVTRYRVIIRPAMPFTFKRWARLATLSTWISTRMASKTGTKISPLTACRSRCITRMAWSRRHRPLMASTTFRTYQQGLTRSRSALFLAMCARALPLM